VALGRRPGRCVTSCPWVWTAVELPSPVCVAHFRYRERFHAADLAASPSLAQELCAGGWSQLAGQVTMMPQAILSDRITVQLFGELDMVSAPRLERRLDQLRRDGTRLITLDLSGVEFLTAAGLSVFIGVCS
jgi:hypothetical protein